jgi:hypothetical protein
MAGTGPPQAAYFEDLGETWATPQQYSTLQFSMDYSLIEVN